MLATINEIRQMFSFTFIRYFEKSPNFKGEQNLRTDLLLSDHIGQISLNKITILLLCNCEI